MSEMGSQSSRSSMSPDRKSPSLSPEPDRSDSMDDRVVVKGLPPHFTWVELKSIFMRKMGFCGVVRKVKFGMAVMEYSSAKEVERVVKRMNGYIHDGVPLTVEKYRKTRNTYESNQMASSYPGKPKHLLLDPSHELEVLNTSKDAREYLTPEVIDHLQIRGPISNQVFVTRIDPSTTWKQLKDVFRIAGNVLNVDLLDKKCAGRFSQSLITFEHSFEAVQSLSMLNYQSLNGMRMRVYMERKPSLGQRSIRFFYHRRHEMRQFVGLPLSGELPPGLGGHGPTLKEVYMSLKNKSEDKSKSHDRKPDSSSRSIYDRYYRSSSPSKERSDESHATENSSKFSGSHSDKEKQSTGKAGFVCIKNFPPHYTRIQIRDLMNEIGAVEFVEICSSPEGICGYVRFSTEEEAMTAVRLFNGAEIDNSVFMVTQLQTLPLQIDF